MCQSCCVAPLSMENRTTLAIILSFCLSIICAPCHGFSSSFLLQGPDAFLAKKLGMLLCKEQLHDRCFLHLPMPQFSRQARNSALKMRMEEQSLSTRRKALSLLSTVLMMPAFPSPSVAAPKVTSKVYMDINVQVRLENLEKKKVTVVLSLLHSSAQQAAMLS